ncbi:prepilin-type N-terminal cleavage/methylation domain-containing protein [Sporosarcina sp. JAI121]|uniref:type IV pilus modification PilV family protein n=1 Tax=Sporosarcina sp. JAI121 TaxID=2723064 RepID=UPI0015CE3C5B|nr:type II secretion system protein [Sporosarcina sp. JAI121]NYF25032.1 prepilin-type N-terminal cleavage/methylation domain-containing protein [Sporosarcina sp. JAI121]
MKKYIHNEKGLTLVEILAALVILGIVFIGFMNVFPQMTLFNAKTQDKLVTMNLAKQELVELQMTTNKLLNISPSPQKGPFKRYIYSQDGYQFEVDYFDTPDLLKDPNATDSKALYKIHIKVKAKDAIKDGPVISEIYGYLKK